MNILMRKAVQIHNKNNNNNHTIIISDIVLIYLRATGKAAIFYRG